MIHPLIKLLANRLLHCHKHALQVGIYHFLPCVSHTQSSMVVPGTPEINIIKVVGTKPTDSIHDKLYNVLLIHVHVDFTVRTLHESFVEYR